jgi:hypothetical protein
VIGQYVAAGVTGPDVIGRGITGPEQHAPPVASVLADPPLP